MKRLLVTGAGGQLGTALRMELEGRTDVQTCYTDMPDLDITDYEAVEGCVTQFKPDYIVNCAAYTDVNKAESDEATARHLNADGVANLARAAARHGSRLVHISTDYVFDGEATTPYCESDSTAPRTAYGRTKLQGEQAALTESAAECVILRTAWLYSPFGRNFVRTMLSLAAQKEELQVVADQFGTPTSAFTLARAVMAVIDAPRWLPGIYHVTDLGAATWYDLAAAAIDCAGISSCRVVPITTDQYPTPAPRPRFSVLSKDKFIRTFDLTLPHWLQSLQECIHIIKDTSDTK